MILKLRDPISGLTHFIGAILSFVGLLILINNSILLKNGQHLFVYIVFGLSMVFLYSMSATYHFATASDKVLKVLRKLDHSAIYVLIAGTYTPICMIALKGNLRFYMTFGIWFLALIGILMKIFWFNAPRWLYTLFYVVMGWISVLIISPLTKVIPASGIAWLVAGGVLYTIGAVIYGLKKPNFHSKYFGFHELFHIFVLLGSLCHYILIAKYIFNII